MSNWYASGPELQRHVGSVLNGKDAALRLWLEDVSRLIDAAIYGQGHFYVYEGERRFTASRHSTSRYFDGYCSVEVRMRQLLSIATLHTDDYGDRSYPVTWSAGDWEYFPFDAPQKSPPWPYDGIRITPNGTHGFPPIDDGVKVVGSFGFYDIRRTLSATLAAEMAIDASTFLVATGDHGIEWGHTLRLGSEQAFVTDVTPGSPNDTVAVERPVNGTQAAIHASASPIQLYTYPLVHTACLLQAYRSFTRSDTPFGTQMQGAGEGSFLIRELDPDVERRIRALRIPVAA